MDKVYTQKQFEEAWSSYQSAHCWKYLKPEGKWAVRMQPPDVTKEKITQCKMVPVKHVMDFPKYLEVYFGG